MTSPIKFGIVSVNQMPVAGNLQTRGLAVHSAPFAESDACPLLCPTHKSANGLFAILARLIMIPALKKIYSFVTNPVHQSMFLRNPA